MKKDLMDLPTRRVNSSTSLHPSTQTTRHVSFNEQQVSSLIETGSKVAGGVMSIAKDLVEISRIRAESQAEVAGIEARSHAMVSALRAETERLMAERKGIKTRGEAAVALIKAVLNEIPESDRTARQIAITNLNQLVAIVITTDNNPIKSIS